MAWWLRALRWGFKLDPTDEQCMVYLYSKDKGWEGPCDLIEICDQVYTKPPWEYHSCTAFPGGEKYVCFAELKKMNQNQNQNRVARTVGSYGTWHESSSKKIYGENNCIIGFNKLLNFEVNGERTDWLMHEFSLSEKGNNEVLCVIQKKKKKGEEISSAYDTYHKFDLNSILEARQWGFKFDPTDDQCMDYLYAKVERGEGPCGLIEICDQVYTKPPWEYYPWTAFPGGEKYFCFAELKKMNQNQNKIRVARTVGSYGTWHESSSKKIYGENNCIIGFNKLLNFEVKGERTDWLMHEFSLPEKGNNEVLCVIQKKKKGEEMCSAYDTYHKFDPNSFLEHESTAFAGGAPCPHPALDSEEEETRPSKKMRPESPDPKFYDDHFSGRDPCPPPALDSEEEKILPTDITTMEWEIYAEDLPREFNLPTLAFEGDSWAGVKSL